MAKKSKPPAAAARPTTGSPGIHIGISDADRSQIASALSQLLADTFTLYLTTHNFHWNVTGPMFNTLHTMFMAQYTELWNAVDPIAERIRSLGHPAPGSYGQYAALTSLREMHSTPALSDISTAKALYRTSCFQTTFVAFISFIY